MNAWVFDDNALARALEAWEKKLVAEGATTDIANNHVLWVLDCLTSPEAAALRLPLEVPR